VRPALNTPELQQAWDDVLRQMTDPKAAEVLARLAKETGDAVKTRQILELLADKLEGDWQAARTNSEVKDLIGVAIKNPALAVQGVKLAARSGDAGLIETIDQILQKTDSPEPVKIAALEGLVLNRASQSGQRLDAVLAATKAAKKSNELSETAIKLLPRLDSGKAAAKLESILTDAGYPLPLRREAIRTLAATVPGANQLIGLAKAGKISDEIKTEATTTLYAHLNRNVREDAAKVLPPPKTADGRTLPPIFELVRRDGDAARGATVFFREAANSCAGCHRIAGKGRWVGPDLSTIGVKYGREELLQSILNPSSAVGYNFRPYILALKDGRVVTGLPVEESASAIVLKTAEGKSVRVAKSEIEESQVSAVSLMPEGLAQTMTDQQLVDLLAYLGTLKRPSSVVGQFQVLGPLDDATDNTKTHAVDVAGTVRVNEPVKSAGGKSISWRRLTANAEGLVDLVGLASEKGQSAYLWTVAQAPAPQKARIVLDSTTPARIWLNGKELSLIESGDQASREVAVDLVKGSNRVLIRVEAGAALGLTVVADSPVEFRDTAATTSVGSR
jgi:putative heme-binding domain-containing protein